MISSVETPDKSQKGKLQVVLAAHLLQNSSFQKDEKFCHRPENDDDGDDDDDDFGQSVCTFNFTC